MNETKKVKKLNICFAGPITCSKFQYVAALCEKSFGEELRYLTDWRFSEKEHVIPCYFHFTEDAYFPRISQICLYGNENSEEWRECKRRVEDALLKIGVEEWLLSNPTVDWRGLFYYSVDFSAYLFAELDKPEFKGIIHHVVMDVKGSDVFESCLREENVDEVEIRELGLDSAAECLVENDVAVTVFFDLTNPGVFPRMKIPYEKYLSSSIHWHHAVVLHNSDLVKDLMVRCKKEYKEIIEDKSGSIWQVDVFDRVKDMALTGMREDNKSATEDDVAAWLRCLFISSDLAVFDEFKDAHIKVAISIFSYILQDAKHWREKRLEYDLEQAEQSGYALEHIPEQTPEICLAAVTNVGYALEFVKEQTPEICLAAVKQAGLALMYVKEQTSEICLEAVKQNGRALEFVKEQTPEICLAAVREDGRALEYVKEQTPEICLEAVRQDGLALKFVREQTPEICATAIQQNSDAEEFVEKVSRVDSNGSVVADAHKKCSFQEEMQELQKMARQVMFGKEDKG